MVEDLCQEYFAIDKHMQGNEIDLPPSVKIIQEHESTKTGIMSLSTAPKEGNVKTIEKKHLDELKKMKLHGQYFNEQDVIPDVDTTVSFH